MWLVSRVCKSKARLTDKTVVITGANTGIGKETARDLYRRGARVILACRDTEKASAAAKEIKSKPPTKPDREQFKGEPGELAVCNLNLNNLASVRECAKNLNSTEPKIHILINNAGLMTYRREKSDDGFETQFQSNYLGHFLLTLLLLPKIKNSTPGCRIINVASVWHRTGQMHWDDLQLEKSYGPIKAYTQTKLAFILFTRELAKHLKETNIEGINVYSLHPGMSATDFSRFLDSIFQGARAIIFPLIKAFYKTPEQGAQTSIHCAVDEEAGKQTGLYYSGCAVGTPSSKTQNEKDAVKLWEESAKLVKLTSEENPFPAEYLSRKEKRNEKKNNRNLRLKTQI